MNPADPAGGPSSVVCGGGWFTATVRREPGLARRFFDRFEPVHAVTYFAPEARAALDGLGYRGFWMGYFAARSAPLGMVPRDVVTAIFYNFAPERVAKALPAAWEVAGPEAALRARQESAVAALRRYGIMEDENVALAAQLAGKAARRAPLDARPLFAANLALPWPDEPLGALDLKLRDVFEPPPDHLDLHVRLYLLSLAVRRAAKTSQAPPAGSAPAARDALRAAVLPGSSGGGCSGRLQAPKRQSERL